MKLRSVFILVLVILLAQSVSAKVVLPHIFSSEMVLQRNSEITFWGWAFPGEEITLVTGWDGSSYQVKTDNAAYWELKVSTPEAGGPYAIEIKGSSNTILLENVLLGEVWLCSGQSNMEWSANYGIDQKETEIANANYPNIRFFSIDKRTSNSAQDDLSGHWEICSPETMPDFSAVAYFFARRLQGELNVPIGLIDSSWGATCAEVWTPEDVFEDNADLKEAAKKVGANPWVTTQPSSLYNALIAPLKNFPIAGTIWYQGESNTANADTYQKLFGKMISAWRNQWGTDFPFYYVQIAPFNYDSPEVGVQVRDAQRRILESIDNTGMVVVSDICTIDDIHPQNKQDVGLRMANLALNHHYKTIDGQVNGPLFKEMKIDGKQVHVFFDHAKGLTSTTKNVGHFEMAGADGKFFPATAKIKNDMVILTSKSVSIPANVRFAWSNTDMATLFNEVGLPASSFTTEEWSH